MRLPVSRRARWSESTAGSFIWSTTCWYSASRPANRSSIGSSLTPLRGHGDDFGRSDEALGERPGDGVIVLLGHCEDESGRAAVGGPSVSSTRHQVGVDA